MNARDEIRDYLLAARMKRWLQIVRYPLLDTSVPRWRARKNYWYLIRRHPLLARRLGYTASLAVDSPLHDAAPAESQGSDAPRTQEQPPTEVQCPSYPSPTASELISRHVSLEDEVV